MNPLGRKSAEKKAQFARKKKKADSMTLYLQGYTQQEIAEKLDISQQAISGYLRKMASDFESREKQDYASYYYRESAKLDLVEKSAWKAWDLAVSNSMETILDENGEVIGTRFRPPPAAYLAEIVKAIAMRYRLTGLDSKAIAEKAMEVFANMAEGHIEENDVRVYTPQLENVVMENLETDSE